MTASRSAFLTLLALFLVAAATAHEAARQPPEDPDRRIEFPDTADYRVLVFDPHTHSSFSDGHVWPRIRVAEAWRDGLDALAITEHLEWQPHLADIPHPDRNRAYQVALEANGNNPLMIIAGSEITRHDEPGHINAVFIRDANALMRPYTPDDPSDAVAYFRAMHEFPAQEALDRALAQGAFLFWNHPWWGPEIMDGMPILHEFHSDNARAGKLHGIEIANGQYYSEEAFQIALDLDLALIGCSDVHELIDWDYAPHDGGHRPVTLVLAAERTPQALREALLAKRTAVWFRNLLLARPPEMLTLIDASLAITRASYPEEGNLLSLTLENRSDVDFQLENLGEYGFTRQGQRFTLPQHSSLDLVLKTPQRLDSVELPLRALNALVAPRESATFSLTSNSIDQQGNGQN